MYFSVTVTALHFIIVYFFASKCLKKLMTSLTLRTQFFGLHLHLCGLFKASYKTYKRVIKMYFK